MPATDISEALTRIVRQVLEIMCFAEAEPTPDLFNERDSKRVSVSFRGSLLGHLDLEASGNTAKYLTVALLGLPEGSHPTDRYVNDTMCELGRTVCGRLLSALDPNASLNIGKARLGGPIGNSAHAIRQQFRLDCGRLAVSLQFD